MLYLSRLKMTAGLFALGLIFLSSNADANLEQCEALVDSAPEAALEFATVPDRVGGAAPAEECKAEAYIAQRYYDEAGKIYENLATHTGKAQPAAELFRKAGWNYSLGHNDQAARAMMADALKREPQNMQNYYSRAAIEVQTEDFWAAKTDLDTVLAHIKPASDAELAAKSLTLRAKVDTALGQETAAMADSEDALNLTPRATDSLLERGTLRASEGDNAGAKRDWQAVVALAPNSEDAVTARNLMATVEKSEE